MPLPIAITASLIGAGGGILGSLLGNRSGTTVNQQPQLTPEQIEAQKLLLEYAKNTPGYTGEVGNYNMGAGEQSASQKIMAMANQSQVNPTFQMGLNEMTNVLQGNKYDPYNEKGVFAGFKKNVYKEGAQAEDILNRDQARTGNLYSRSALAEKGKLAQGVSDTLSNKLAELYDIQSQRKQSMIPTAMNAGISEENIAQNRIKGLQDVGALERILKDQELKDKYNKWETENRNKLDALKTSAGMNVPYGVNQVTVPGSNPWADLLNKSMEMFGNSLMKNEGKIPMIPTDYTKFKGYTENEIQNFYDKSQDSNY